MKRYLPILLLALLLLVGCSRRTQGTEAPHSAAPATYASTVVSLTQSPSPSPEPTPTPEPTPEPVVFLSGRSYGIEAERIDTPLLPEELEKLDRLPALKVADISGSKDYAALFAYRQTRPELQLIFTEKIGSVTVDSQAEALDISQLKVGELDTLIALLPYMEKLQALTVDIAQETLPRLEELPAALDQPASASLTLSKAMGWAELSKLRNARRDVTIPFPFRYKDRELDAGAAVLDLNRLQIGPKNVELIQTLAELLKDGTRVDMERCRIGDKDMDALREACPRVNIVWVLDLGRHSVRTDSTRIRLVMDDGYYPTEQLARLKYCHDTQLLDLGHNILKTIEFTRYMPKLRVAILAIGYVHDLTPLMGCSELEYLELFDNQISDLTPLSGLSNLKHLNLTYNNITDPSPLHSLSQLERLWIGRTNFTQEQKDALQAALPNCEIDYGRECTGGTWRTHPRYFQLREEFDYDHPRNGGY